MYIERTIITTYSITYSLLNSFLSKQDFRSVIVFLKLLDWVFCRLQFISYIKKLILRLTFLFVYVAENAFWQNTRIIINADKRSLFSQLFTVWPTLWESKPPTPDPQKRHKHDPRFKGIYWGTCWYRLVSNCPIDCTILPSHLPHSLVHVLNHRRLCFWTS